jgi:hypothetical protein
LQLAERTAAAASGSSHTARADHVTQGRKKKHAGRPRKATKTVKKTEKPKKNDRGFEL